MNGSNETRHLSAALVLLLGGLAHAQPADALPSPLRFDEIPALARTGRPEVAAAAARTGAAEQRPAIVSALEDPMIYPSIDHWPFGMRAADASLTIEQRFPLSGILDQRRREAEAEAKRVRSEQRRTVLDVQLDAVSSFLLVYERRGMLRILEQQRGLALQFVGATNARYASSTGSQADVIRAEMEAARIEASLKALTAQLQAAERMLNASLGRAATLPVPQLEFAPRITAPPEAAEAVDTALAQRPELAAGQSEIARAEAELDVMRSMYLPTGMVKLGPSYTMTNGWGSMLMIGVSIPIWRDKLKAGVSEAEAKARMAKAELEAMRRLSAGQAAAARDEVVGARSQYLGLRDDVLPRAQQAIAPTIAGYASGQLPLVSVLDAARTLWATQEQVLEAEVSLGASWARLGRATGDVEGVLHACGGADSC